METYNIETREFIRDYINGLENHFKYIYKVNWYESKKHKIPTIYTYYENEKDTRWIFETQEWIQDLVKVEYIKVCPNSVQYKLINKHSLNNIELIDNKETNKKLIYENLI